MIEGQILQVANALIGLSCVLSVTVIAVAKISRSRADLRSSVLLMPYRSSLLAVACGEDEDSQAKGLLCALSPATWDRLRPSVVTFLTKVRGASADDLAEVLRSHGEIETAKGMLTSRSAVRRARATVSLSSSESSSIPRIAMMSWRSL